MDTRMPAAFDGHDRSSPPRLARLAAHEQHSDQHVSGHVFHLALGPQWRAAMERGAPYDRSTIDASLEEVGFIHCSFASQLRATFDRYYPDEPDVLVLTIDPTRTLCEIRVEDLNGGGEAFPHLYGPLPLDAVVHVAPWTEGTHD